MKSSLTIENMSDQKPSKLFAKYAIPQMIGLLLNSVYLIVDGIFIGNRLGRDAMAAAAVSVPFIEVLIAISLAVASGSGIIISNLVGRKEYKKAKQVFNQSVRVTVVIGLTIVILGNIFLDSLATFLGASPSIHSEAVTYLWYIITFSPFLLFSFLLGGLARNDSRPKLAMLALAAGSVLNIVLDYVFMYPLNMGIAGAALATALGPIFSILILLPHFLRKKGRLYFDRVKTTFTDACHILKTGFPSFIMEFTIGIVTFIYNSAILKNGYGEMGLASYLIIGYMMLIILTVFLGLAEGLQPVFSFYNGIGDAERNKEILHFSKKVFLCTGAVIYLLVLLLSSTFISIFAPNDLELIQFTSEKSIPYFSGFIFAGYNILMISFWQSVEETKQSFTISLLRSVIVLPVLIVILPQLFGRKAVWISHSLCELITAGVAVFLYWKSIRNKKESHILLSDS